MKKHKLDLDLALPSDAAACDACVERMVEALGVTRGISGVHVDRADPANPKLCLHYDPTSVRIDEVESLVKSTGAALRVRYEHLSVPAVGLRHERQARLVEGVFARQPGVLHASVAFGSRRLYLEFEPAKTNQEALLAVASKAGIAWLGTGAILTSFRTYRSFDGARSWARSQQLKSQIEWREFTKSWNLPPDIPADPRRVYGDSGWSGFGDWLGADTVGAKRREACR